MCKLLKMRVIKGGVRVGCLDDDDERTYVKASKIAA